MSITCWMELPGKAKVKLSFAAWKGQKVAPATFEVPVVAGKGK